MAKRKKLIVLVSILILTAAALIFAADIGDKKKYETSELSKTELTLTKLAVRGMTCSGCAYSVKTILTRVDGVESASVDYEDGSASVKFDSNKTNVEKIVGELNQNGYGAEQIKKKTEVDRNES